MWKDVSSYHNFRSSPSCNSLVALNSLLSKLNWSNAVVIFDEAHNLESVASEASSFELTSAQIAGAQEEALRCHNLCTENGLDEVRDVYESRRITSRHARYTCVILERAVIQPTLREGL